MSVEPSTRTALTGPDARRMRINNPCTDQSVAIDATWRERPRSTRTSRRHYKPITAIAS